MKLKEPDPLRPRDTAELAAWICDEDNPAKIAWWKAEHVVQAFKEAADAAGVILGPPRFYELKPGEGRAGVPPDGVQGTNVRLLVAEADVQGLKPIAKDSTFLAELSFHELEILRKVTRRGARPHELTDEQCDHIIARYGPVTAQKILKSVVDDKIIH